MRIASLQYAKMFACPPLKQKGRINSVLFALAEAEGFEPPWAVSPNGFQDRLVVTASIRLRAIVIIAIVSMDCQIYGDININVTVMGIDRQMLNNIIYY